ncbi:uncharacterized protein LOC115676353 isoform X1 [Syzygium oleosum]|uniref:uncharacterized protein LOC115676353 isoform X1 n=1 Tax=Syzygium oleosum TaxID=219896 RepID=UPI0011D1CDE6|nr:uncharacterized protein LOC115676353 isoform X1 [Syzygium oleosum]
MAYPPHYRSQFGDTTLTKVFVGGLAWETPTEDMRRYFEQFGEILEAVIITDKNTGKSKGYGFVTFRDPESARRACVEPNPVIDGRRANCNIASMGRPRPSPPRGRAQGGNYPYQGGALPTASGTVPYSGRAASVPTPPPPPPPFVYPPYGYSTYPPEYGYHQAMYNPVQQQQQQQQYYQQMYGGASASTSAMGGVSPYYYGYSLQTGRGAYSAAHQAHRIPGPSYVYYPAQAEGPLSHFHPPPPPTLQPLRLPFTSPAAADTHDAQASTATETSSSPPPPSGFATSQSSDNLKKHHSSASN